MVRLSWFVGYGQVRFIGYREVRLSKFRVS